MPDEIDAYLYAYNTQKDIERMLAAAKKQTAEAKELFVAFMESHTFTSVKRNGMTITHSKRSFPSVKNFELLETWVQNQDEPRSLYMEEGFIKGTSKDNRGLRLMVEDAQKNAVLAGAPVSKYLPPGLEIAVKDIVTVRAGKKEAVKKEPVTAVDKLKQQMDQAF